MRIKEGDKWKMAFCTQYSYFKYQVMSFIPLNTLASFQVYISKIIIEKLDIFVIMNLDDIFIYTKDLEQACNNAICWILGILQKHSLFAKPKTCYFHKNEVRF